MSDDEEDVMAGEDTEGEELLEDADYSRKSDFSKALIVKEQVQRCLTARSKEMKSGYYNYKINKDQVAQIYVPDSRREFVSAVKALRCALEPETRKKDNSKYKKVEEELVKAEEDIFKKYAYYPKNKREVLINNPPYKKVVWVPIKDATPYIPEIDTSLPTDDPKHPLSTRTILQKGLWNNNVFAYWEELIEIYDELFAELNVLIHLENYFKQGVGF